MAFPTPRFLAALLALLWSGHVAKVSAFDYNITSAGDLSLTDVETKIGDMVTIFTGEPVAVSVTGLEWQLKENVTSSTELRWETSLDGVVQVTGVYNLNALESRELPSELNVGEITVDTNGRHTISVKLTVDDSQASTEGEYQAYASGVAIIPVLVVLLLAMTTQMVEVSLLTAVFVGACMVAGNLSDGFKQTLDLYIRHALADEWHAYVYLFTMFLSGLVSMMEKSGGMIGFTRAIAKHATTARAGQAATFTIGILVFFDDYANTLLAGETMQPLTDLLGISREKLAFVVDATAAPVASIAPISSWVGFEIGLIQTEIDRIIKMEGGEENVTIETSGMAVFLQSIKYRYYPIFMLILMPILIATQRDFGPMLIAERKTQVYNRIDGGDGKGPAGHAADANNQGGKSGPNDPRPDTPALAYNMALPIVLLVFLIFYLLVQTGNDGSGTQSFMDMIESSDSYAALLWGTMATTILTVILYWLQLVQNGKLAIPTWPVLKQACCTSDKQQEDGPEEGDVNEPLTGESQEMESSSQARSIMDIRESVASFLHGMGKIFPALVVLTLAWASGSIMIAVGADRLFARWIVGGVPADMLPTLSFIISGFMALATGTSWGTMTILFPLICVPAYQVSDGDPTIFYATVAGILSGSVAGDHVSPISDTTVLSALASDCDLIGHVKTQAPYVIVMVILAICFGTIPIGKAVWPNIVGILLGVVAIFLFVFGLCVPVLSPTGRYDIFNMIALKIKGESSPLHQLQEDTIKYHPVPATEMQEDPTIDVKPVNEEANEPEEVVPKEDSQELQELPVEISQEA